MLAQLAVVGLLAANAAGSLPAVTSGPKVQASQETAALLTRHAALVAPRRGSVRLRTVASLRPITNERTVLPVIGHATDGAGRSWLRVMLPGRPNGGGGWIERTGTRTRATDVRLVVDTTLRQVTVYRRGRVVRTVRAVVGRPGSPTPHGEFFVEEAVALPANAAGAPYALALSARSEVYEKFDGGPGQIAIHARGNIGGTLGTGVSHGCVRLTTEAMRWLVMIVGPGVPVTIRG